VFENKIILKEIADFALELSLNIIVTFAVVV
jgi:hypothetical protein